MGPMKTLFQAQMAILANSHKFGEEETRKMLFKVANLDKFCKSAGCYELRKPAPKDTRFPQSRYCVEHAIIAKANAQFLGHKLPKVVDKPNEKE